MLGVPHSEQRPPWGSTLVYELYRNTVNPEQHAVRLLFNGQTLPICGDKQFCTWEEFSKKIEALVPPETDRRPFYDNYKTPNL